MKEEVPLLEFSDVTIESRGFLIPVRLKLSDQGVAFRNINTGKSEQLAPDDINVINWQRMAGAYGVRIFMSNGNLYRFAGFKESDQTKLEKCFQSMCDKPMVEKEFSVKGWNYGATNFEGEVLSFDVSSSTAFEIPVNNVSGCITGKNEVTLEFHQHDDAAVSLMEMRFYLPPSELAGDEEPVETFKRRVMRRASIVTATGDALAIFSQVQCLTPRGRYDMKMYPSFIQLHGKTFDFKIPTNSVLRLFLLPHLDGRQHFFVVSLDPPIKQGQTRYPYLIVLFANDVDDHVELPLSKEELKEKFENRLEEEMSGPQYEVISRIYKGLCNRKIVTPGNFVGHTGTPAISCSYKAAAGYLYPLERGFFYVHKPPIHIRFDEISLVNFARSGSNTRTFDFEIECRNGTMNTFSSIEKGEYHKLYDYVTSKKLRIKNTGKGGRVNAGDGFSDSDAEAEPDHYMDRVRAEARERDQEDGNNDDDESDDSDFNPDQDVSDVAEEYDTNASGSSGEESGKEGSGSDSAKRKIKKDKKERTPKKAKTIPEPGTRKNKKRSGKAPRDANAPKRPSSAYFIWLSATREEIKKKHPGISVTEIAKKGGMMWKELKDKSEWENKAAEARRKYEITIKEYKASSGVAESSPKKVKKPSAPSSAAAFSSPNKSLGAGSGFKSKEYIEESSSSEDSDDKPLNKIKDKKKPKKVVKKKKKEESEEEEEGDGDDEEEKEEEKEEESEMSGDESD